MANRGPHDMGGDAAGPIDRHEHAPSLTERRIDAIMQLLRNKPRGFWTTDENRRTIESLAPETYAASGYYERWTYAMRGLLVEKGVLSEGEIAAKLTEVKQRYGSGAPGKGKGEEKTKSKPRARNAKPEKGASGSASAGTAGKSSRTKKSGGRP